MSPKYGIMANQRPKILMLGWEYPPYMTGGLGVACQGLVNALLPYVKLSFFLPKTSANPPRNGVQFVGMNHAHLPKVENGETISSYEKQYIEVFLHPYEEEYGEETPDKQQFIKELPTATDFSKADLYEGDLFSKVKDFAHYSLALIYDKHFDIIHAHDWMTFPAALAIRNRTGKPLVLHVHSTEYDRKGKESKGWVYELEKTAMQAADYIIAVSHYTAKIIREHYEIPIHKVIPVHNSTDIRIVPSEPKSFPEKLITFAGRITPQKNPKAFLDIATKVLEDYDNVRFVIAGIGSELPVLMQAVAARELSHKIHFTGYVEREYMEKLYAMTDIFVMPSISEPFGIAALEAARYGIPVLTSRNCGVLDILKGAFTADHKDIELFADYILTLLEAPELAARTGIQLATSTENTSWTKAAEAVLEIYQMLMKQPEYNPSDKINEKYFLLTNDDNPTI